ncbi:MAG: hypothetical protein L0Y74_02915 [candidate division Zixibacteria bacterium]|nr:hypothetical protein [candidate division Zixibacteria bacterium]
MRKMTNLLTKMKKFLSPDVLRKKSLKEFFPVISNNRGISMLEILIGGLMSLIIAACLMEFYINQHNQWLVQEQISDMQQNGRVSLDELTRQIRSAGYGLSGQDPYLLKADTLIIYSKPGANVDTVRFYVDNSNLQHPQLMKKVDTGAPQLFAENISQMSVTEINDELLQINLTARQNRPDQDYAYNSGYRTRDFTTSIKLRNTN